MYRLTCYIFLIAFGLTFNALACANALGKTKADGLFSPILGVPQKDRVDKARAIYTQYCRKMPERNAMACLDTLNKIAKAAEDLRLQCAVFDMRADLYSVHHGYNTTSDRYCSEAIRLAAEHDMLLEEAIYMHRKAVYLSVYKQNIAACRYFLFSQEKFKEIGYEKVPQIGLYLNEVGAFYYSVGDNVNARNYLNEAMVYLKKPSREYVSLLNTIGLSYRNTANYRPAIAYFKKAFNLAVSMRDTAWMGISKGNIGSVYFLQKRYDEALPLIITDYHTSLKYRETLNAAIAMLRLVRIGIERGNYENAKADLQTVDSLLSSSNQDVLRYRADYFELKASLNAHLGQLGQARTDSVRYDLLSDSVSRRDNLAAIERVRLQWELDRSKAQLNHVKAQDAIGRYKRNSVIITLGLLIVIISLIFNRRQLKAMQEQQRLAAERSLLDQELKSATVALHEHTRNLMQKNLLIEDIREELEKLKQKKDTEGGALVLEEMMKAHIMTEENWTEFKRLFSKVHTTFFYQLRNQYSHLTQTDVRLLALIRLNLNNREMSGMLGITTDGVKKAKQRLRKKMDLDTTDDLDDIVRGL